MTITDTGNITQPRDKGGLVKAMIYVNGDGTIARCFNGMTNSSSGGCGFSVSRSGAGVYVVNFGFQVNDRFYSLTLGNPIFISGTLAASDLAPTLGTNKLWVSAFDVDDGGYRDTPFTIIVY